MSRPTDDPAWATATNYAAGPYSGNPNRARPPSGNISEGFDPGAGLPAEWLNYLVANHGSWLKWLLTLPTTSSDLPQYQYQDAAGNTRAVFDHNGYPTGRRSEFREDWIGAFSTQSGTAATLTNFPKWAFNAGGGTDTLSIVAPTSAYPSPYMDIATPATSSEFGTLYSSSAILSPSSSLVSFVFECEVGLANIGAAVSIADIGLGHTTNALGSPPYGSSIMLRYSGSGNWIASTSGGGSHDTGVPPVVATGPASGQRFRIEVHGSASPYGAMCRFFINEALVATLTTGIPSNTLFPLFTLINSTAAINHMYVGSVYATWNRFLASPSL